MGISLSIYQTVSKCHVGWMAILVLLIARDRQLVWIVYSNIPQLFWWWRNNKVPPISDQHKLMTTLSTTIKRWITYGIRIHWIDFRSHMYICTLHMRQVNFIHKHNVDSGTWVAGGSIQMGTPIKNFHTRTPIWWCSQVFTSTIWYTHSDTACHPLTYTK